MKIRELRAKLAEVTVDDDTLVQVLDETGLIYTVVNIILERHDDGDGSQTLWLQAEEI